MENPASISQMAALKPSENYLTKADYGDNFFDILNRIDNKILNKTHKKTLSYLAGIIFKSGKAAYPRQKILAKKIEKTRGHLNKVLSSLVERGFIKRFPPGYVERHIDNRATEYMLLKHEIYDRSSCVKKDEITHEITHEYPINNHINKRKEKKENFFLIETTQLKLDQFKNISNSEKERLKDLIPCFYGRNTETKYFIPELFVEDSLKQGYQAEKIIIAMTRLNENWKTVYNPKRYAEKILENESKEVKKELTESKIETSKILENKSLKKVEKKNTPQLTKQGCYSLSRIVFYEKSHREEIEKQQKYVNKFNEMMENPESEIYRKCFGKQNSFVKRRMRSNPIIFKECMKNTFMKIQKFASL